ncbi:MAG: alpha/beta hydrolase [Actinobacteria bacterium]|nr:alpha/beta hydrolase [Actinomycetota bacterium]
MSQNAAVTVEDVGFPGSTGARLAGVLHRPDGGAVGSVLLAHCFTCSKDLHTTTRIAGALAEAGYAVLRFDFTGIGASGGDFRDKTVSRNVRDLVLAATHLIERGYGPCGLVGHSLGGAAVLLAAARMRTVRSVAVLGAPATVSHVRHLMVDDEEAIRRDGVAQVVIGGRPFPISRDFLDDLDTHDVLAAVESLGRPLLVLHAVNDEVVPVNDGEAIFAAARQPKSFVPLIGADHLLTDRGEAAHAAQTLVGWLDTTLRGGGDDRPGRGDQRPDQ